MSKNKGYAAAVSGAMLFVFMLVFAEEFKEGFSSGLKSCYEIVIPSLFPFLIASSLVGNGKLPKRINNFFTAITKLLFRLPGESFVAIVLGQLGGYLSGAKAAQSLCSSGKITMGQAEKMMFFCINPGLGFAVNALGSIMLGSRSSGKIIFISILISSVICGIIARFIPCKEKSLNIKQDCTVPFSQSIVNSVSSGTFSLLVACSFVCVFSAFAFVAQNHIENEHIRLAIICLLEITSGCIYASKEMSLPFLCAICAFGGICVHLQIFSVSENFRIRLPIFYAFRLLNALIAFAVCYLLLSLFPSEQQVILNVAPEAAIWSFSAPSSFSLLFLSALLILDLDNKYKI